MTPRTRPHVGAGILCVALLASPWAIAQTRIDKCGGSATFNGTAKVAFFNLERDTEVSIKLHSTIKGHAVNSTVKASIAVDGKTCGEAGKSGEGGQDVLLTCPGVGVKKGRTLEIVAGQTNSLADDMGNTLTVECFARGK
ncbi:MAG: hypothetical protein AB1434_02310 [Pseudomonadota bacterium]